MTAHIKRISALMLLLLFAAFITSCGAPEETKQEAAERLETYRPLFEQKASEAYGDSAKLKKVECPVEMNIGSPVPDVTYKAGSTLTAKLVIDGMSYDAEYYPDSGSMIDTVHTEDICGGLVDSLPIDGGQILKTKFTDSAFEYPMFDCYTDTIEKASQGDVHGGEITINIITDEDLGGYTIEQFSAVPEIEMISRGNRAFRIKIVSLKDHKMLSELTGKIQELHFTYPDNHPTIYDNEHQGSVDAFEYYHIESTIELFYELSDGSRQELSLVYND